MRTNKTRSALTHRRAPHVRTRGRCRDTRVSFCIRCFSPRSSFPPAPHLVPHRHPVVLGGETLRRNGEHARMICNFNNQSHERRLIFIMITPPLYLAWERELEIGVPHTKRSMEQRSCIVVQEQRGVVTVLIGVIRESICLHYIQVDGLLQNPCQRVLDENYAYV